MNTTQHPNPMNTCDRCEKLRYLAYYDPTGEALCEKCTPGECLCGCGTPSYSRYRPGHDAKHVSVLLKKAVAGTLALDTALGELPSEKLRNKLYFAYHRAMQPKADIRPKNRCGCGRAPKGSELNPEICDICWEEAGWENDHMDGNHEQGERSDVCPMCR